MKIKISELNKKIEIYKIEEKQDNEGNDIVEEVLYLKTWSKIVHMSGMKIFEANRDYNVKTTRFIIRFRKDKNIEKDKDELIIRYKNDKYNIKFTNNLNERNEFIEIVGELIK